MLLATAIAIPTVYIVWSWSRRRLPLRGLPRSPVAGLRDQLRHSRAHAAQSGALMPLGTSARVVTEANIPVRFSKWVTGAALLQYSDMAALLRCVLRPVLQFIVSELEKTASAAKPRPSTAPAVDPGKPRDVFASLDPDLLVTDALPHHNIILNKFPVVPDHIVIVTKNFEPQESPLSIADWEAVWYWCVFVFRGRFDMMIHVVWWDRYYGCMRRSLLNAACERRMRSSSSTKGSIVARHSLESICS